MNYKLAKQLKDAGFPQEDLIMNIDRFVDSGKVTSEDYSTLMASEYDKKQDRCFIPTLSELIEACGASELEFWIRKDCAKVRAGNGAYSTGKTPSEAVANLYCEINKK